MRRTPEAGLAGARLRYPDGKLQYSAFAFPGVWQTALDLFPPPGRLARVMETRLNGRYPRAWFLGERPFEVETLLGACLLARREAIESIGFLDEGYFMYAEELDWCRRAWQAGWKLYCVPQAEIVHYEGQATRQFQAQMLVELWRSRLRLFARHYRPPKLVVLRALVWAGATWGRLRSQGARRAAYGQIATLARRAAPPSGL
jgi:GT2 family glycosyltransferase